MLRRRYGWKFNRPLSFAQEGLLFFKSKTLGLWYNNKYEKNEKQKIGKTLYDSGGAGDSFGSDGWSYTVF